MVKKNPFISVIIPTYNRGWIVKEAIDSVLAQDFINFELIVVDDGSTDSTQSILDTYCNAIIVIKQKNRGVSSARNKGIATAQGKYIAFLDSDDLWFPQKLSLQVDFIKKNPNALILQTEEIWIKNGQRINPKYRHKKSSGMFFERSLNLCLISPSAVMISKDLFDKVGTFDNNFPVCEDYDLWLRITYKYPAYLIDTPLVIKRGGHDDQLSKTEGMDKYRILSIKKLLESKKLSKKQFELAVKVMEKKCQIYANGCKKRGRIKEAKYYQNLYLNFSVTLKKDEYSNS